MYLSVVMVGRNDGYGGDFIGRMHKSLNCLTELGRDAGLDFEIVFVDWNPPRDKSRLRELFPDYSRVSFVEVETDCGPPMLEYCAKNVGIRKAQGKFVLATNPDVVPNRALAEVLATQRLDSECFYRADRWDTVNPSGATVAEFLESCEANVFRINTRWESIPYRTGDTMFFGNSDRIHTNACGDFTLMSKVDWIRLKGYPEVLGPPHHIDSFFLLNARNSGLHQVIFQPPAKIYHIEHERKNDSKPMSLLAPELQEDYKRLEKGEVVTYNDKDWGTGFGAIA